MVHINQTCYRSYDHQKRPKILFSRKTIFKSNLQSKIHLEIKVDGPNLKGPCSSDTFQAPAIFCLSEGGERGAHQGEMS